MLVPMAAQHPALLTRLVNTLTAHRMPLFLAALLTDCPPPLSLTPLLLTMLALTLTLTPSLRLLFLACAARSIPLHCPL